MITRSPSPSSMPRLPGVRMPRQGKRYDIGSNERIGNSPPRHAMRNELDVSSMETISVS